MIQTERLLLRPWRAEDLAPFAALNADPEVMEHFPTVLDRAQSDAQAQRIQSGIERDGFGLFAAERRADQTFIGFIGLAVLGEQNPLAPGVEIGWRLVRSVWGQGLASEGARACLAFGFSTAGLASIVSFTAGSNLKSQAVMDRIGMVRRSDLDFEHPAVDVGHPLRRHLVWTAEATAWRNRSI